MRALRLTLTHWRIAGMNELQYRANFWVQLVHSALALVTGLVAIGLVFRHTTDLVGWSQPELLIVMGIHVMVGGVLRTFVEPNMRRLMTEVEEGTFDYVMTKPLDAQVLSTIREVKLWHLVDVLLGAGVLVYGMLELAAETSWLDIAAFAVTLFAGIVMIYCVWIMITSTAFRVVRSEEVLNLFEGFYQTGRWPVSVYPLWLRGTLTFLVPLAFAITVPAESLSNRLTGGTVALAVGFCAVLLIVTRVVWLFNLRHYSGASA